MSPPYAPLMARFNSLGEDKWKIYRLAQSMIADGQDVIELAIGEPDLPPPTSLIDDTIEALQAGRLGYSTGQGELGLRDALAKRYSQSRGRAFEANQFICFPGTQTALFACMQAMVGPGDEVLVGDPLYATYDAVITSCGAQRVSVPLGPEQGFRLQAEDLAQKITPQSRLLLLNAPHNPTGAVLRQGEVQAIAELAIEHDLWILADEVYEELIFEGTAFYSPLAMEAIADRVVAISSISKSHAAPGLRSGWCVGPLEFCQTLLPFAEAMLFGNQPAIADATAKAIAAPSPVAQPMCRRFAARAERLVSILHQKTDLKVLKPAAGMFALVDVSSTGLSGEVFAERLLAETRVAVMPGGSFGPGLASWLRVSLTQPDERIEEACEKIANFANKI